MNPNPTERPILFSGEMVRAILDGRKTMTRRVINGTPAAKVPFKEGQKLWVKEAHRLVNCECPETCRVPSKVWYEADASGYDGASLEKLRPSIFMPRWASRISLEVVAVRTEPLRNIETRPLDIAAEGVPRDTHLGDIQWFRNLWTALNGEDSWNSNPTVYVVTFRKL